MKELPTTTNDLKTNYLLLHGYGEALEVWGRLEPFMDKNNQYPINLIELFEDNNYSQSFEALAKTIITQSTKQPPPGTTIIANSMGGYIAMELLHQNPGRFQQLILISTHPFADTPTKIRERQREIALIGKGKAKLLGQLFSHPHQEAVKSNLANMWQQWSDKALTNALKAMITRVSRVETILQSTVPIHFIIGQNDKSIDIKQLESIANACANTSLHLIPEQGHWQLHHWQPPFTKVLMQCLA